MSVNTTIEWARHPVTGKGATWNVINGCTLVSEGCRNCYAADLAAKRLKNHPSRKGLARINGNGIAKFTGAVRFNQKVLADPQSWKTPRGIFVCAHGDLFHEYVSDAWIDKVYDQMQLADWHIYFVLTKRPWRARRYMVKRFWGKKPPLHIWMGTSIEDQPTADTRVKDLVDTPAAMRFVSAEPLLKPVALTRFTQGEPGIDWVISGGESGRRARFTPVNAFRSLRDQCADAGIPFFHKQNGMWLPSPDHMDHIEAEGWARDIAIKNRFEHHSDGHTYAFVGKRTAGRLLNGRTHDAMPEVAL